MNDKPSASNREEIMRSYRQLIQQSDAQQNDKAQIMFTHKQGLMEAIKENIYPALVMIKTINGIVGMGFFQHSQWLVSNAHIIQCSELIEGATLTDYKLNELELKAEASYHRPSERPDSPDVVVIKTNSRHSGNNKCLPTQFSDDESYGGRYIFYLAPNVNNPENYEIKFLKSRSKNMLPLIYQCEDGTTPMPGCSGTPIIEARVISGREAKWQFRVVGILYARCSSAWYNQLHAKAEAVSEEIKLVCAIPVIQEFLQILETIRHEESAERTKQMALAAHALGDKKAKIDEKRYLKMSEISQDKKRVELKRFEDGESTLNIFLPEGLEKLWYKSIKGIEFSLLIEEVRNRELTKKTSKSEKFYRVKSVSLDDLKVDFDGLIQQITNDDIISLRATDNFYGSPKGHFRVDVGGGGKKDWMLDIQDNTGKLSHNNEPLSSVFAKAKLPKSFTSIEGGKLAALFLNSHKEKKTKDISSLDGDSPASTLSAKKMVNNFNSEPIKKFNQFINPQDLRKALTDALNSLTEARDLAEAVKRSIEDQRASLKENILKQAKSYGFACHDVERDGSCFFHAVSDQLKEHGHIFNPTKLREIAVDHILDNLSLYEGFMVDVNTFISSLLRRDEWADQILIQALSRALKVTFIMIRSDGSSPTILKREGAVLTLYLGYEVGMHYQSLHRTAYFKEAKIKNLIDLTELDSQAINEDLNLLTQEAPSHVASNSAFYPPPVALSVSASNNVISKPSGTVGSISKNKY
jgi:hypothetical protein